MDKDTFKLLKKLYSKGVLSRNKINAITNFTLDEHHVNPHESLLLKQHYANAVYLGTDDEGCPISDGSIEITLDGKAFIEHSRQEKVKTVLPIICSIVSLLVSIAAFAKSFFFT